MSQPVVTRSLYYRVFGILLGLTLLTMGIAFRDIGPLNTIIALSIATAKALLVLLFFMHLRYSGSLIWLALGAAVFWLVLLITGTLHDYLTRGWYIVSGW
jgi:cytochrome c oxidase subunit 4